MSHIIIEGPDGAGKTSLARALLTYGDRGKTATAFVYQHAGPPSGLDSSPFCDYVEALDYPAPHLFDRLHLGEVVYPIVTGRNSGLGPHHLQLLRRVINGRGSKVILCLPPWDICCDRWAERNQEGHEFLKKESLFRDSYSLFSQLTSEADIVVPYRDMPLGDQAWLYGLLQPRPALARPAVGSPDAKVLFVGERPGTDRPHTDCAFVCDRGSSLFLNVVLGRVGFHEQDIAFVNAYYRDYGNPVELDRVWDSMPRLKTIVALGSFAARAVKRFTPYVPVVELFHPSYVKRFQSKDSRQWEKDLSAVRRSLI